MELDLNKPIFVIYVNVKNLTSKNREEILKQAKEMFSVYSNITTWIISSDENKIDCIYDGRNRSRKKEISKLSSLLNEKVKMFNNIDDLKLNIRDWKLDQIIGD